MSTMIEAPPFVHFIWGIQHIAEECPGHELSWSASKCQPYYRLFVVLTGSMDRTERDIPTTEGTTPSATLPIQKRQLLSTCSQRDDTMTINWTPAQGLLASLRQRPRRMEKSQEQEEISWVTVPESQEQHKGSGNLGVKESRKRMKIGMGNTHQFFFHMFSFFFGSSILQELARGSIIPAHSTDRKEQVTQM